MCAQHAIGVPRGQPARRLEGASVRIRDVLAEPEAIEYARAHDWLARYAAAFPEQVRVADQRQRRRVAAVVADVSARPASTWEPR